MKFLLIPTSDFRFPPLGSRAYAVATHPRAKLCFALAGDDKWSLLNDLIEQLRLARRAAAGATAEDAHDHDITSAAEREDVADLHLRARLLDADIVAPHAPFHSRLLRQRPRLVEPRMPQPLVDTDAIRHFLKRAARSASDAALGLVRRSTCGFCSRFCERWRAGARRQTLRTPVSPSATSRMRQASVERIF